MQVHHTVLNDGLTVLRCGIAFVAVKTINGILNMQFLHHVIPKHLGDYGGRTNGLNTLIPLNHRHGGTGGVRTSITID